MKSASPFLLLVLLTIALSTPVQADEIIVTGTENNGGVTIGDFDCSGCVTEANNSFSILMEASSGHTTAGELWKFFRRQGIKSVDQLTICLDIPPESQSGQFGLDQVQLMIEDPSKSGGLLTKAGLGEHSLVVPDYEISPFKPEAQLKVALGYDFMQRFSADSTEKISLNYSAYGDSSSAPAFTVQAGGTLVSRSMNMPLLAGFIMFWVMVFVLLTKMTRPKVAEVNQSQSINLPPRKTKQALSA